MRDRRWLPELDEHDKDLYEEEKAYERWLNGRLQPPLPPLRRDEHDDSFVERDPYDRLKSEGGHLSE